MSVEKLECPDCNVKHISGTQVIITCVAGCLENLADYLAEDMTTSKLFLPPKSNLLTCYEVPDTILTPIGTNLDWLQPWGIFPCKDKFKKKRIYCNAFIISIYLVFIGCFM